MHVLVGIVCILLQASVGIDFFNHLCQFVLHHQSGSHNFSIAKQAFKFAKYGQFCFQFVASFFPGSFININITNTPFAVSRNFCTSNAAAVGGNNFLSHYISLLAKSKLLFYYYIIRWKKEQKNARTFNRNQQ